MSKGIVEEVLPLALLGGAVYFGVKLLGGTLPSLESAISGGLAAVTPGATVTPGLPPSAAASTTSDPNTIVAAILASSGAPVPACAVVEYQIANHADPSGFGALFNWAKGANRLTPGNAGWRCQAGT